LLAAKPAPAKPTSFAASFSKPFSVPFAKPSATKRPHQEDGVERDRKKSATGKGKENKDKKEDKALDPALDALRSKYGPSTPTASPSPAVPVVPIKAKSFVTPSPAKIEEDRLARLVAAEQRAESRKRSQVGGDGKCEATLGSPESNIFAMAAVSDDEDLEEGVAVEDMVWHPH
jgi:hypothetical protein